MISMVFLRLLVNVGFIFSTATTLTLNDISTNDTAVNYRLPDNVMPVHYNIKLMPYIIEDNFTFDGESNIKIEIRRTTRNVSLHALDLTIYEAATSLVNGDDVFLPMAHNYNNVTQILTLDFDDELSPGLYILNLKYVGTLNDDLYGFFRTSYKNEQGDRVWLAVSHFEATWARRAFPCWDEPALKATFNISIRHHRNYTALSNMPIRKQSNEGIIDGMMWTYFDTTPIMSTYLVVFVVTQYVRVPNGNGTINMWCRSQLAPYSKYAQEIAKISGQQLTQYTNSSEKVPKMDHVAVPKFPAGAMENWGLIIYRENNFAYKEEVHTTKRKHKIAVTVTHEMAHQWFGNVISPLWWSYIWLNEGFASFFENYILDQIFKDWRMMDLFVVQTQHPAFYIDVSKNMMPITAEVNSPKEIESLFSISSYGKASVILRMMQHIITEDLFHKGIIKYLQAHQFNSATPNDLWSALQTVLDESDVPHNAYRLKEVMDTWTKQRHYPVVNVIRNYDTGETILRQEHFRSYLQDDDDDDETDDDKWWVPLTFATKTNPDFSNTLPTHWLRPQDENITINGFDPNDWIIVNLQQTGYYLVNYDPTNWQKIADYLDSDDYTKIHVLNRAQLINDAYLLLMSSQINISTFLKVITYLPRETDYIPWCSMFSIFDIAEDFFRISGSEILKPHIVEILDGLIKNVGYEEQHTEDDFIKLKRIDALEWACNFGHSECKRMANIKLNEHLADPEIHKILPNLRQWTYCMGLMIANASTWNKIMDMYMKNPRAKILLDYLACSENPDIIKNYLDILMQNYTEIQDKDYRQIFSNILFRHADNELILDHILANFKQIVSRIGIKRAIGIIHNIYSTDLLDKVSNYIKDNYKDEDVLKYAVKEIEERVFLLLYKYSLYSKVLS